MSNYLFIESRDPFESRDTQFVAHAAAGLKSNGHTVTVFLVQNGVLSARDRMRHPYLRQLRDAGIRVLADDFSLQERGIRPEELNQLVRPAGIETLVDLLVQENTKTIWH